MGYLLAPRYSAAATDRLSRVTADIGKGQARLARAGRQMPHLLGNRGAALAKVPRKQLAKYKSKSPITDVMGNAATPV
jgi:hypothetical protein